MLKKIRIVAITGLALLMLVPDVGLALPSSHKKAIDTNYVHYFTQNSDCVVSEDTSNIPSDTANYKNPVYEGVAQGPTVVRGDDGMYHIYLTSDDQNPFKHLKSRDLVNWAEVSRRTLSNLSDIPREDRNVMWAPDVAKTGDHYTMVFTGGSGGGSSGSRYIGYATSDDAGGPFTYRGKLTPNTNPGGRVLDPHLFVEGNKIYVTYGSSPIAIREIRMGAGGNMELVGPEKELVLRGTFAGHPSTIEQSWLHKIGEWYYMFYSAGHFENQGGSQEYSVRVARSQNLMGPYNPENHSRIVIQGKDPFRAPGASTIIQDDAGTHWMFYNAFKGNDRRLMLDKLNITDGWPVANNGFPSSTQQNGVDTSGSGTTICCPTGDGGTAAVTLPGNSRGSNGEKLFVFLINKGLTAKQAAGILGNVMQESGGGTFNINPRAVNPDSGAYGIIQWLGGRKTELFGYAERQGKPTDDLQMQMDFMWRELNDQVPGYHYKATVLDPIKASTNYTGNNGSLRIWLEHYEIPCNAGAGCNTEYETRLPFAERAYNAFKDLAPADVAPEGECSGANAYVDSSGFAFPVVLPKNDVSNGYSWPCRTTRPYCHHDGTPAFDLAKKALDDSSAGVEVVAINEGKVTEIDSDYKNTGCQALHFKDKNGWDYWYGHIRTDSRTPRINKTVRAGTYLGKIGERVCTGNGSYPHLHIDRGYPKGTGGGVDENRDAGFLQVVNDLYRNLP